MLIFSILAALRLNETGQIWGIRARAELPEIWYFDVTTFITCYILVMVLISLIVLPFSLGKTSQIVGFPWFFLERKRGIA